MNVVNVCLVVWVLLSSQLQVSFDLYEWGTIMVRVEKGLFFCETLMIASQHG